jgi:hypothetical protein
MQPIYEEQFKFCLTIYPTKFLLYSDLGDAWLVLSETLATYLPGFGIEISESIMRDLLMKIIVKPPWRDAIVSAAQHQMIWLFIGF